MKITGKAKEDFERWYLAKLRNRDDIVGRYFDNSLLNYFWSAGDTMIQAFIVEWLDSVGIYIEVGAICIDGHAQYDYNIQENNTLNGMNGHTFSTRHEATQQAINKAIEIYNNR